LGPSLAAMPSRQTPQLVPTAAQTDVRVHVRLPAGARLVQAPGDLELSAGDAVRFALSVTASDAEVRLRRQVQVPVMRVAVDDYPRFAGFCRAVDQAEAQQIAYRLSGRGSAARSRTG